MGAHFWWECLAMLWVAVHASVTPRGVRLAEWLALLGMQVANCQQCQWAV